jgi:tRNA threonylcarbamoyladenosine biosynthesis protein TsaE
MRSCLKLFNKASPQPLSLRRGDKRGEAVVLYSVSAADTAKLGRKLFQCLEGSDVVILEGALGGGKTTFIKGLMAAAGFKGRVLSPTFTLLRQYKAKKFLFCHVDLYRLDSEHLEGWGLEDLLYASNVITLIEWGEKIEKTLDRYIKIVFEHAGEDRRRIKFSVKGYKKDKLTCLA